MGRVKQTARKSTGGKPPRESLVVADPMTSSESESLSIFKDTSDEDSDRTPARKSALGPFDTYDSIKRWTRRDAEGGSIGRLGGDPKDDEASGSQTPKAGARQVVRTAAGSSSKNHQPSSASEEEMKKRINKLEARCLKLTEKNKQLKEDNERLLQFAKRAHRFIHKDDVADLIVHPDRRDARRQMKMEDGTWPPPRDSSS